MTDHVCGAFDLPLRTACCACCGLAVFAILETIVGGPRAGEAARIGPMLEGGTQVELVMNDGSIAHCAMCVACATNLTPDTLLKLWDTNVARTDELARLAGRREPIRRALVREVARKFPVGVVRWRRQDPAMLGVVPDGLVIDRRRPK